MGADEKEPGRRPAFVVSVPPGRPHPQGVRVHQRAPAMEQLHPGEHHHQLPVDGVFVRAAGPEQAQEGSRRVRHLLHVPVHAGDVFEDHRERVAVRPQGVLERRLEHHGRHHRLGVVCVFGFYQRRREGSRRRARDARHTTAAHVVQVQERRAVRQHALHELGVHLERLRVPDVVHRARGVLRDGALQGRAAVAVRVTDG
mmetsp:Transcript_2170/g.8552  ORF Transcript_2170/g.8552 Transcript_2170/m.8552 type:complete len:200 (+) Transcript_2170:313-912(+)